MPGNLIQKNQRFYGLPLAKMVTERRRKTGDFVVFLEPVFQKPPGNTGYAGISFIPPFIHGGPQFRDQKKVARPPARFINPPTAWG
jgi:hypothetical protein